MVGGLVGIVLPLLSKWLPKKYEKWVPSPAGLGLAWTFHWYYSLLFFTRRGASATALRRQRPKQAEEYHVSRRLRHYRRRLADGRCVDFRENGPPVASPLIHTVGTVPIFVSARMGLSLLPDAATITPLTQHSVQALL